MPNLIEASAATTKIRHTTSAESPSPASDPGPGFSSRLSWSRYRALLKVDDPAARSFYEVEAASENWTVEHLERQIFTQLHSVFARAAIRRA